MMCSHYDERSVSFLYLTNDKKESKLLLIGVFSEDELFGYKKFFQNIFKISKEISSKNKDIISLKLQDVLKTSFDCVILSGNLATIKKNTTLVDNLLNINHDINIVIKIKEKHFGVFNRSHLSNFKKKFGLLEYLLLPTMDNFKLMLDCNSSFSCLSSLKLFNPVTLKQIVRNYLISFMIYSKLIWAIPVNVILISSRKLYSNHFFNFLINKNEDKIENIALHNASAGSGTKAIIAPINRKNGILGYLKISNNEIRKKLINNEFQTLSELKDFSFSTAVIPICKEKIDNDIFTAIYFSGTHPQLKSSKFKISKQHIIFLSELFNKTIKIININNIFENILLRVKFLSETEPELYSLIRLSIDTLKNNLGNEFPLGLAHRDFVPWNIKLTNSNKIYVYDWEWAEYSLPFYDLFHFIIHGNMNINNISINDIIVKILKTRKYNKLFIDYAKKISIEIKYINLFLLYYLSDRFMFESFLGNKTSKIYINPIEYVIDSLKL